MSNANSTHDAQRLANRLAEQYEAAIPKCCSYQTVEAHESIMLCWGLAAAVERGETMNCDNCTENTMKIDAGTAATEPPNAEIKGQAGV